ncbi:hypothetical protein DT076_16605 [Desertihabitans brevis]|uniref:Tail terminator n=1 Tax=Desertihabitans brevis TaxID=2268447 RepID=A0A367YRU0_9ACTN|nr:hypothetical protein [Desertihabitans brevis]RCK68269.1 hypothetical protein DT076_16605 [Desertihabitans brevis]
MNLHTLTETIWQHLKAETSYTAMDGQVIDAVPDVAYVVFYPGAGWARGRRAADLASALRTPFQLTCAGWSREQAANTVEIVRSRFTGWRPFPDLPSAGRCVEDDTGMTLQRDDSDSGPPRFWLPLRFHIATVRSPQ